MNIICLFFIIYIYPLTIQGISENVIYSAKSKICPVSSCNNTSRSEVKKFCSSSNEIKENQMIGRCCIENETNAIIGLDLSSCGIKSFNSNDYNFTELVILDLRDNDLNNLVPKDLTGLLNLAYLYLPYWIPCPGGKDAWNETRLNETYCYLQKNPCVYLNISCTDNGECIHNGPADAKCVCKPNHYGYKCMIEEEFPSTAFSVTITVTTAVLSVILWFAHGRDAYKRR